MDTEDISAGSKSFSFSPSPSPELPLPKALSYHPEQQKHNIEEEEEKMNQPLPPRPPKRFKSEVWNHFEKTISMVKQRLYFYIVIIYFTAIARMGPLICKTILNRDALKDT